ncbi:uncharacterized protein BCR38DRAFT_411270 [Pseudomassariella vexata]|uniref:Uncharacterized protein n=1 Tax=Pseudomassariella vexata TaxID=1141098 RepID=A0A1Y2DQ23_9PEZI|nr:uncharacterized protein BCR38DRAFT_411270 [Pseudomassariella vexata]ORY61392.1 hypothetical protein BCR38DRAFT_411270 [Pseudomassariella vexata]
MTTARDSNSRLRQTLNPLLTTSLGGSYNSTNLLDTPYSAVSVSSPYGYSSSLTPASSIQPYNPREWGLSPAPVSERNQQFPSPSPYQDSQVSPVPPPPPPYSPPRSQRPVSTAFETPPANISAARIPPTSSLRPSPEPQSNQNFPPPPNTGGRGASRERRFGLPSLGRRRDATESMTPPDSQSRPSISRPQTLAIQIPTPLPPNSRRAASASAIDTPVSARSRSASQTQWAPGMPLPPPPPGPPPSNSRSQSLSRTTEPVASPPTRRPPPGGVTALGPVPPTPADWVEEERYERGRSPQSLTIDTTNVASSSSHAPPESSSESGSAGGNLTRAGALRMEKTLRERRTESRTRHSRVDCNAGIQPLSDILVPQGGGGLTRRFSVHKGTPRSAGRPAPDSPWSGGQHLDPNLDSRNSTPRQSSGSHPETPTPPFSPHPQKGYPITEHGIPIAPKSLPTPPPQSRSASSMSISRTDMHSSTGSLMPGPPSCSPITKQTVISQSAEQFCKGTIERLQSFAKKEAAASTDADRVKLFADFIVNESRVRRERYNSAIGAMGSEIFDLTRDLFRPMAVRRDSSTSQGSEWTPQMSETKSHRNSISSIVGREPIQQSNSAPASAGIPVSPVGGPPTNVNWTSNNYKPALSPILSMSVSEQPDEADSRGRPASRWWEADSAGEASTRLERSKRESKYMGVPKEAREALQWRDPPNGNGADAQAASSSRREPSDEYPPEKVGWHESEPSITPQLFRNSLLTLPASTPNTPSPSHLDVSRLVTLPPPYPRHHPAVNNNHPELTDIRTLVRSISDMREIQETKARFTQESQKMRAEATEDSRERCQALRVNLQQEISSGAMSYAEAATIEADYRESEKAQSKDLEKKDFERFQNVVVMPLNDLLTGRISQATSLFDELRSRLFTETQASNPNMPQEEGDEQPELLEKLTLLKWIFEAREMLHREIYDLLSDRNDRYKEMVIMPYRLSGNEEKIRNAEGFFAEDAQKRRAAFANEVLQRTREFRGVVEENVERGVDMQLNAFWDIAPPLKRLLDKIPLDLERFRIHVPPAEYEENPDYHQHPLQYLFSLLLHAEKSTYQFIESQTNLLCLLHEVKEAVMGARAKVSEAEGCESRIVEEERKREQDRLTDDLKEKVRVVQDQWEGALGDGMRGVKERVGEWLLSTGGWDESLEDRGVGGA